MPSLDRPRAPKSTNRFVRSGWAPTADAGGEVATENPSEGSKRDGVRVAPPAYDCAVPLGPDLGGHGLLDPPRGLDGSAGEELRPRALGKIRRRAGTGNGHLVRTGERLDLVELLAETAMVHR